jgi:hypothetical protein
MKLGLGLYRHQLDDDHFQFAAQAGCEAKVIHLVDYFRQGGTNTAGSLRTAKVLVRATRPAAGRPSEFRLGPEDTGLPLRPDR